MIMSGNEAWNRNVLNADGRLTEKWSRYHVVRKTVPDVGSGDWEGPAADGRQFNGRHQQTIGPSRADWYKLVVKEK